MILRSLTLVIALLITPAASLAADFYYVIIFGSEDHPKHLRNSHTWATFVHAAGEGTDAANYQIETRTISWYPASLDVHVFSPHPEPGVNLTLEQTLDIVRANGESVTLWGPFRIRPELFERAMRVADVLDARQAQYRAISGRRNLDISDCIHAVAAIDPVFGRGHYPLIRIGKPASRYLARQIRMRSVFDQTAAGNAWLIPRLGLDPHSIEVVPPGAVPAAPCGLCLTGP